MKVERHIVRSGYDGRSCLVHARCCYDGKRLLATAQPLNVQGNDAFTGIQSSVSMDGGRTWSPFKAQSGLAGVTQGDKFIVCSDGTPLYHKKTGKILLLGHTVQYTVGSLRPDGVRDMHTFYSVYDEEKDTFSPMRIVDMPEGFSFCGNGSGQSLELDNGDLLIPVDGMMAGDRCMYTMVMRCSFDGETVRLIEYGNRLEFAVSRGIGEPSIICHKGVYYMTIRNDECALVARSTDGLHYEDMHLWQWEDGSLLDSYNTQQHWMEVGDALYLVYTRRGANNDHVFRHRAPLFAARVENMRLVRGSEFVVVPERGARLGNFCAAPFEGGRALVMAAEWMQPIGCEKYGSDNSIYFCIIGE